MGLPELERLAAETPPQGSAPHILNLTPSPAALDEAPEDVYETIKKNTLWLLRRRLEQACDPNPKKRRNLEDKYLIKLGDSLMKLEATRREKEKDRAANATSARPQTTNILNLIHGLPTDRAKMLLVQTIRTQEAAGLDASATREALAALVGEVAAGKLLAIEAQVKED